MQIVIDVPDSDAQRVTDALSAAGGRESSEENAKQFVVEHIQRTVVSVETSADRAEREAAAAAIEPPAIA